MDEEVLNALRTVIKVPKFSGKNVPIYKVAEIMGKNQQAVREGLKKGILPIGTAIPKGKDSYTYYVSPKLLYEYTGAIVNGEGEESESGISYSDNLSDTTSD